MVNGALAVTSLRPPQSGAEYQKSRAGRGATATLHKKLATSAGDF